MLTHSLEADVVEFARHNDGLVRTRHLRDLGHSDQAVRRRTESGLLVPVCRGVVALAGTEITPARRSYGITLVSPGSWISHTTALAIHGATLPAPISEAHVSSSLRVRGEGVAAHQRLEQPPRDLAPYLGTSISRPWLAVIESAGMLDERSLRVAVDSLVQSGSMSLQRLQRCVDARGRFLGLPALTALLDERLHGSGLLRSFLEADLDALLTRNGLPKPVSNHRVTLSDGQIRIIDKAWPDCRVALEAESWRHHSSTTDWGRSRIRDRELTADGWIVLAAVVEDIRRPERLIADLTRVLGCAR
jgi:hypothetical protein